MCSLYQLSVSTPVPGSLAHCTHSSQRYWRHKGDRACEPGEARGAEAPRRRVAHFGPRREARVAAPSQRLGAPRPTLQATAAAQQPTDFRVPLHAGSFHVRVLALCRSISYGLRLGNPSPTGRQSRGHGEGSCAQEHPALARIQMAQVVEIKRIYSFLAPHIEPHSPQPNGRASSKCRDRWRRTRSSPHPTPPLPKPSAVAAQAAPELLSGSRRRAPWSRRASAPESTLAPLCRISSPQSDSTRLSEGR
jgi:hypothetical protein